MKQTLITFTIAFTFITSGCSSQNIEPSFWLFEESSIEPIKNNVTTTKERIFITNYDLQQKGKASIGESFIKFMDYDLYTKETEILIRERDNREFLICGVVDQKFFAITSYFKKDKVLSCDPTKKQSGPLINKENLTSVEDERCQRWSTWGKNLTKNNRFSIELMCKNPENKNPHLSQNDVYKRKEVTKKSKSETFNNFELIYSGISSNDTINILYREFSPQDMARQAFFQNLTYPLNSDLIRFKGLRIQLISINNESIEYIVKEQSVI